jgi:hypothetical protein
MLVAGLTRDPERQAPFMPIPLSPSPWRWVVVLSALCCFSCSGGKSNLNAVEGKVLDKEGKPAKGAVVTFHPKQGADDIRTILPVGLAGEDGTFKVTTGQDDGAAAGDYIVTIIWPEEVKKPKGFSTELPDSKDRLQGRYADRSRSTFKVEIKKGANQLEPFTLK